MTEWEEVSLPIIEYVWACEKAMTRMITAKMIGTHLGVSADRADSALLRLVRDGWIAGSSVDYGGFGDKTSVMKPRVGPKGLRALGEWSTDDPFSELMSVIEARIALESDPVQKSKWMALAKRLTNIGSAGIGVVLGEFLKRAAGMGS